MNRATSAFREACRKEGYSPPAQAESIFKESQPAAARRRLGRAETDRERRARVYLKLKNYFWYERRFGGELVEQTRYSETGPTYIWPDEVKDCLRSMFPRDVQGAPNPGRRDPSRQDRPLCVVTLADFCVEFGERRLLQRHRLEDDSDEEDTLSQVQPTSSSSSSSTSVEY
ncbi:uncharacterized protein [Oscarella lobularis]|uniref:uncharacterized protein n=1 Tax=Oscarella lobularis TaxID=121494 RepID=UPI0033135E80